MHLLGLLGVHGSHVLVVAQRVLLLLLLHAQVTPQGLQDPLGLWTEQRLLGPAAALCAPPSAPRGPFPWPSHLRWVPLQSCQEAFQGSTALVVDDGDDSRGVGLHEALPLTGYLFLQGLQDGLEVLARRWAQGWED